MKLFIAILLALGMLPVQPEICAADSDAGSDYMQVKSLLHLDSSVSGGENDPETLAAVARNAGAEAAFITDHDTQKVTLGIWPLRNILRISVTRPSIRTFGIEKYLAHLRDINSRLKDCIVVPGIEAVPYYSWEYALNRPLTLRNLHRHILVFGLEKPYEIEHLPSIETGFPSYYTRKSLLGLAWLLPFLIGLFVATLPRDHRPFANDFEAMIHSGGARIAAFCLMGLSVLFIVNGYPFREPLVDQYGPDRKQVPCQELINYVHNRGGLTFWAHPEAEFNERFGANTGFFSNIFLRTFSPGGIRLHTEPYHELLNDTFDYTGFAIFCEGSHVVGKPEGLWDMLLMQYCTGRRDHPVWAVAELDLEKGTDPVTAGVTQTVLLVREKTKDAYLDALRNGRMYAFTAGMAQRLVIRDYSIISGNVRAVSGEVVDFVPDIRLSFAMDISGAPLDLEIMIVADGRVIDRRRSNGSTAFELPLKLPEYTLGYTRIVIYHNSEMVAATNPIFINSRVAR